MRAAKSDSGHQAQPVFILIAPQMGENIGAAARAMWNFGLERMRVTAPRDGWPNPNAVAMASGAGRLLDEAQLFDDTASALADLTFVFATTARVRGLSKPVMDPVTAMEHARELMQAGEKVGVMFGPERAGLTNEDAARAQAFITIPVNPEFPSLNLAQSVLLNAYEWRRHGEDPISTAAPSRANRVEVEHLIKGYLDDLDAKGFFWPADKAEHMRTHLISMLSRLELTEPDIRILHGIRRALTRTKPPKN